MILPAGRSLPLEALGQGALRHPDDENIANALKSARATAAAATAGGAQPATPAATAARIVGDLGGAGGQYGGGAVQRVHGAFVSDDDPELVRSAVPFALKAEESLLSAEPGHRGLLLALARGFTQYAVSFVWQDAVESADPAAAKDFYTRSLEIRSRLAPGSLDVATSLNNLGNVALQKGDDEAAWAYFRQALVESAAIGALALALGALARIVPSSKFVSRK